jgi:hypothetical protein
MVVATRRRLQGSTDRLTGKDVHPFSMSANHLLIWNAQGLNSRAQRSVIHSIAPEQRASIICIHESKLVLFDNSLNIDLAGFDYDYAYLPSVGYSSGSVLCWHRTCGAPQTSPCGASPSP